jgi:pimeloyl-ACP methyl ester carboxylesterase
MHDGRLLRRVAKGLYRAIEANVNDEQSERIVGFDRLELYMTCRTVSGYLICGEDIAGSWNKPVEVWGMNYPGSCGPQGPPEITRVGPDALAVYDAIKQIAGNRPIFIQGWSLGTTAALCVAAARPVNGLILLNPPPLRQLIVGEYSWWNLGLISHYIAGQIPADLDSIANASRAKAPAVILCAGSDQTVPPKYQRMVIEAYRGEKRVVVMAGQGHEDELTAEATGKLTAGEDWLWQVAKRGGPAH